MCLTRPWPPDTPLGACLQGLDPASRRLLWDAIRVAARGRALVLTTHSMEEAEALCDRLGVFLGANHEESVT